MSEELYEAGGSFDDIYNGVHMEYERVARMLEVAEEIKAPRKLVSAIRKAEASLARSLELVNEVDRILRPVTPRITAHAGAEPTEVKND